MLVVIVTLKMSDSNERKSNGSTTQQTGAYYTSGFSTGFIAKNERIMENGKWLYESYEVIATIKNSNGTKTTDVIGDIDFICRITEDVQLSTLFPIVYCANTLIPANSLLLIEVTSMSGDLAKTQKDRKTQLTKLETKLKFYNLLFTLNNKNKFNKKETDIDIGAGAYVLFVYNGADFLDISESFQSLSFESLVVYLPLETCMTWSKSVEVEKAKVEAEKANVEAEKAKRDRDNIAEDIARRLKKSKVSTEIISLSTGLTEEYIESLST